MLSGALRATSGDIFMRGKKVEMRSTTDAIAHGIETIYQDSALVTQLSIARNLFLGREPIKGPRFLNRMDTGEMEQVAGDLLKRVGIGKAIPASTPISSLSGGERQAVAIARAMHFDSDLIILDEPTNNLGVAETQGVLRFVRNARDSGHSCIFIAHNIHHVFQVVDRIVVMRRGQDRRRRHRPESDLRGGGRARHHRRPDRRDALANRERAPRQSLDLPSLDLASPHHAATDRPVWSVMPRTAPATNNQILACAGWRGRYRGFDEYRWRADRRKRILGAEGQPDFRPLARALGVVMDFPANDVIFLEGDPPRYMYVVLKG